MDIVDVPRGRLWISPAPPDGMDRLVLRGLAIGRARADVRWSGGRLDMDGLPAELTVITERAPVGLPDGSS